MKKLSLIIIAILGITMFSCQESEVTINKEELITQGEWRVLFYFDDQGDKVGEIIPFSFQFIAGGALLASDTNKEVNGSWSINEMDNDNGTLTITFAEAPLKEMGKKWVISNLSANQIDLILFNGNGSENLVFAKM